MVVVNVGEHESALVATVLQRPPDHFHRLLVQTRLLVLVVDAYNEKGLESHLAEERGGGGVMSKGIDVPGNFGHVVESVLQPAQTHSHLVDEILVVHVGFVRHAPPRVDELDLSVGHQRLHLLLLAVSGLVPPSVEEGHFDDGELVLGVFGQFADNRVDGVLHSCELGPHVPAVEIVVDSLEPSDVVVGVGNEVHGERGIGGIGFMVVLLEHFFVVETKTALGRCQQQSQRAESYMIS